MEKEFTAVREISGTVFNFRSEHEYGTDENMDDCKRAMRRIFGKGADNDPVQIWNLEEENK